MAQSDSERQQSSYQRKRERGLAPLLIWLVKADRRRIKIEAAKLGISMGEWVVRTIKAALK